MGTWHWFYGIEARTRFAEVGEGAAKCDASVAQGGTARHRLSA